MTRPAFSEALSFLEARIKGRRDLFRVFHVDGEYVVDYIVEGRIPSLATGYGATVDEALINLSVLVLERGTH